MKKLLFICHGNICRSPMAEFLCKDMAAKRGLSDKLSIASAATTTEEIGNPVHHGTVRILEPLGISTAGKTARQVTKKDYQEYDLLLCMENQNLREIKRILPSDPQHKICRLLDFTDHPRDIADPWYTGNFEASLRDIQEGCTALLDKIEKELY